MQMRCSDNWDCSAGNSRSFVKRLGKAWDCKTLVASCKRLILQWRFSLGISEHNWVGKRFRIVQAGFLLGFETQSGLWLSVSFNNGVPSCHLPWGKQSDNLITFLSIRKWLLWPKIIFYDANAIPPSVFSPQFCIMLNNSAPASALIASNILF